MNNFKKRNPIQANETGFLATNIARKYRSTQQDHTDPLEVVLRRLKGVRRSGKCWIAFCPAHHDLRHPSLSVAEGDDGRVLVFCFAGCTFSQIVAGLGLNTSDLFSNQN